MHRLLALAALIGFAHAQAPDGWTVDTTLKTFGSTTAVAADGDVVVASRHYNGEEAAIEVHRYNAATDRYALEATLRDPSWLLPRWRGFSASMEGGVAAIYSRPIFAVGGSIHVVEAVGGVWAQQEIVLPGSSVVHAGANVRVDGQRILSTTAGVFQPIELHFIERGAGGAWAIAQSLPLSLRALYPPENPGFIALDGDVAAATSAASFPLQHFALCRRDPATGLWAEERLIALPDTSLAPAGVAIEGNLLVLGAGRQSSIAPHVSVAWIIERLPGGGFIRRQEIRLPGLVSQYESNVRLEDGRLLLAANDDVHVYEANAAGIFVKVAEYRGLGLPVALLNGSNPGTSQGSGPSRIVGRDGRTARIAPFPLPPVPGAPFPTFDVRQDVGVGACYPSAAGSPTLRYFAQPSLSFVSPARRAAGIENGTPAATALIFASVNAGFFPAAGGALCLERSSLVLAAPPASIGPGGDLLLDLNQSAAPIPSALGDGLHVQALIFEPNGPQLTNAVHFVQ